MELEGENNEYVQPNTTNLIGELVRIREPWLFVHTSGLVCHGDTYSKLEPLTSAEVKEFELPHNSKEWWFIVKAHGRFNTECSITTEAIIASEETANVKVSAGPEPEGSYGLDFNHDGKTFFNLWPGKWVFQNIEVDQGDPDVMHPKLPLPMNLGKEVMKLVSGTKDPREPVEVLYWRQHAAHHNKITINHLRPPAAPKTTLDDDLEEELSSSRSLSVKGPSAKEVSVKEERVESAPVSEECVNKWMGSDQGPTSYRRLRNPGPRRNRYLESTAEEQQDDQQDKDRRDNHETPKVQKHRVLSLPPLPSESADADLLASPSSVKHQTDSLAKTVDQIKQSVKNEQIDSSSQKHFNFQVGKHRHVEDEAQDQFASMYDSVKEFPGQEHVKCDVLNGALEIHDLNIYSGDLVEISFSTDHRKKVHTEKFRWYFNSLILEALNQIRQRCKGRAELKDSLLLSAPTLFWNCFLRGEGKGVNRGLANLGWLNERAAVTPLSSPDYNAKKRNQSHMEQDKREKLERKVMAQVVEMTRARNQLYNSKTRRDHFDRQHQGGNYSKRSRRKTANLQEMVDFLDCDGFPTMPLDKIPLSQRRVVYKACCENVWNAPLDVRYNEKGRAVYAAARILKGDFICRYAGEYIKSRSAMQVKTRLHEERGEGCYMFYFLSPYTGGTACIDATEELWTFGVARLVNHSYQRPNVQAMAIPYDDKNQEPALVFICKNTIEFGEELLIDYGETDKRVLQTNPWLLAT